MNEAANVSWTWDSIIDACGGTLVIAEALRKAPQTVSGWRRRPGGIPAVYWSDVVTLASEKGRPEVTCDVLAGLARSKFAEARP